MLANLRATWRTLEDRAMRTTWQRWVGACSAAAALTLPLTGTALMQGGPPPRASDGQSLAGQSRTTQDSFVAVWGDEAPGRWVIEHEAELVRLAALTPPTPVPPTTSIPPPATNTLRPAEATATLRPEATETPAGTSVVTPTATPVYTSLPTATLFGGAPGVAPPTSPPTSPPANTPLGNPTANPTSGPGSPATPTR
jgi:hypothetical protein